MVAFFLAIAYKDFHSFFLFWKYRLQVDFKIEFVLFLLSH